MPIGAILNALLKSGAKTGHAAAAGHAAVGHAAVGHAAAGHMASAAARTAQMAVVSKAASSIHVALSSSRGTAAFVVGSIGIPIFTGAVGNLVSNAVQDLVNNHSAAEKELLKNPRQAQRVYRSAVSQASKAFLDYNRTHNQKDLERYIKACADAQLAFNFINANSK